MIDRLLFLYHNTIQNTPAATTARGLSSVEQLIIILIFIALVIGFLWYIKRKR
jgi:hypothetical protein